VTANSDTFARMDMDTRAKALLVAARLENSGGYRGSSYDALTDACAIVLDLAAFPPAAPAVRDPQEEIRQELSNLRDELGQAQAQVDTVAARMRALQRRCKHPNAKRTRHMGESCTHCYDCGNCP